MALEIGREKNLRSRGTQQMSSSESRNALTYTACEDEMKYELTSVLGSGCFGYVFLARTRRFNKKEYETVAIKRVEKVGTKLSREFEILSALKHTQHCVQLRDCFFTRGRENQLVQNLVLEYIEDDLERLITRSKQLRRTLPEDTVKMLGFQLFKGLAEIHKQGILHRDLKPENILLNAKGGLKICDFGSSKFITRESRNTPYIVSRFYRAPELFLCYIDYDGGIDIWAAACILCELFTLTPIFRGKSEADQLFAIFRLWGSLSPAQTAFFAAHVPINKSFIEKIPACPRDSATLNKLFGHLQCREELFDLLLGLFEYHPEKRLSAKKALEHPFFASVAPFYEELIRTASQ